MTIVACWINREIPETDPPRVWVASDSRISNGQGVLLDRGAKIFPLQITCRKPGPVGFFSEVYCSHSIGFTYAGSSLVALNVFAALQGVVSHLVSVDETLPSIADIAVTTKKLLEVYVGEVGAVLGHASLCEILLTGFCQKEKKLTILQVTAQARNSVEVTIEDYGDTPESHVVLLGERKRETLEFIAYVRNQAGYLDGRWWRAPLVAIESNLRQMHKTIVGPLQLGIGGEWGFNLMAPVTYGEMRYLGLPFEYLNSVGGCGIAMPGMVSSI